MNDVFHIGEKTLQTRYAEVSKVQTLGTRMIRDFMLAQHQDFFGAQEQLFIGGEDAEGKVWASVIYGLPGFLHSPSPHCLNVTLPDFNEITESTNASLTSNDPLGDAFNPGAKIGLLGIDFSTRRRNRLNASVLENTEGTLSLKVLQSYGNCPKYIWQRTIIDSYATQPRRRGFEQFSPELLELIARADTLFIASRYQGNPLNREFAEHEKNKLGFDISHRGGQPGFIVHHEGQLWLPDYSGNNFFNTLGNILLDPYVGILIMEFDTQSYLQLSGSAQLVTEKSKLLASGVFDAAERALVFELSKGFLVSDAIPWKYAHM